MRKLFLLVSSLCSLLNTSNAQQPGDLDSSFGNTGYVYRSYARWSDMAIYPDGKLLVVGNILAKYNVNGTSDSTFGTNGVVFLEVNDTIYTGEAICIQADGKIVVVGGSGSNTGQGDFVVIRYKLDGSLDSTFDGDGILLTDLSSGSEDHAYELAIQTDGKILVAGVSDTNLALIRYHPDGSLDNTFDNDGKLVFNSIDVVTIYYWLHPNYIKLQTDGKILAGTGNILVRLNVDGSLDNDFGTGGMVTLPHPINDIAIQPDNKMVLAGGQSAFAIVRLEPNGDLDNDFGNGGLTTTSWFVMGCYQPHQLATSITLQPDGRILAGGFNICCLFEACRNFVLNRYDHNGSLDSSFGVNGQVQTIFPTVSESHASVITPDLKIVLAGYDWETFVSENGILARYHLGWIGWPVDVKTAFSQDENIVISPNPTFDHINIRAYKIDNGNWHLELRDITGRTILQEDVVAAGGSIQKKVSLNELPAGLYFVELNNGTQRKISKVVKM